jgi:hypothetical protein
MGINLIVQEVAMFVLTFPPTNPDHLGMLSHGGDNA